MPKLLPVTLMLLVACGVASTSTTLDAVETATTSTSQPETASTVTTTVSPTTTTAASSLDSAGAAVNEEYQTAEGWQYQVLVAYSSENPNPSQGGCLDVAPPGQTNDVFILEIRNLLTDRPAPTPTLIFASNLGDGGQPIAGADPFDDELTILTLGKIEVVPNAPDTSCLFAQGMSGVPTNIEPEEPSQHLVTVGPILTEERPDLIMGLRMFTGTGEWIDVTFTRRPGSGVINLESTGS